MSRIRSATSSSAGDFSMEHALAARPDLAVYTLGMGPNPQQVAQLERAGIPVVFIDFFSQPLERLEPSLTLLGAVTGRSNEARALREERIRRRPVAHEPVLARHCRTGLPPGPFNVAICRTRFSAADSGCPPPG